MKYPWIALVGLGLSLLIGCSPTSDVPPADGPREVPEYGIDDFLATVSIGGGSFSPDKSKLLISSDESGVSNAYALPLDGGSPVQLTESEEPLWVVGYFPQDERFLFSSDQGGNELNHVFVRELDGSVRDLTPGEGMRGGFAGWAEDEASFFVQTNERDPRVTDIYRYDAMTYERELFHEGDPELNLGGGDISPDERYMAFVKIHTTNDSDVVLLDRQSGEYTNLTTHEGQVTNSPHSFSRDSKSLFYTTNAGSEFAYLMRYDLASGEHQEVLRTDWDVAYSYMSRNGRYLVVGINNDARNELRLYEAATLEPVALPELAGLDITKVSFSRDTELMAFFANSARMPQNLYLYDFSEAEPRRLTQTLNPNIDPQNLVDAEVVRFASYDGVEIPGLLYKPHNASAENKVPGLVLVHGGPGGQSRIGYNPMLQYLVNHGYGVYAINNRGSSGYGKTFFAMDDRRHGDADLKDCIASKQLLIDTGWIAEDKIGIIGGSYGGYMVLAALAFTPEEFDVGVDIFGVSNWVRTLESIPEWWETFRLALYAEIGDPSKDGDYLRSISPLFHAENIVRPLMVLQGANDPRVLQVESDEIVDAVRANGVPVEYLVFEDEGHGFRKKENQEEAYTAVVEFLDRYLKGEAPPAAAEPAEEEAA